MKTALKNILEILKQFPKLNFVFKISSFITTHSN